MTLGEGANAVIGAMPQNGAPQTSSVGKERGNVENARARSQEASQPASSGRVK